MQNDKEKFKNEFNKRLVRFSVDMINFAKKLKATPVLWPISDQIVRSATSVGANVTEAKGASSKKDYTHFFTIALKSANETKYWLMVIKESEPNLAGEVSKLEQELEEISKIIGSSILTLKGKR